MPTFDGTETEYTGRYGSAQKMPVLDAPLFVATVAHWLVTHPQGHPFWSQYLLAGVSLSEYPGMPPANLQFPGATHEITLAVINPEGGLLTLESTATYWTPGSPNEGKLSVLQPINIAWQMTGTDDECNKLVTGCAWAIVNGVLWPETGDAPERVRNSWSESLKLTLKHLRGEPHEREVHYGCQH